MKYFFLCLLICLCIFIVLWSFNRRDRIYQYPFLISGFFGIFVIPQAISLINNPGIFTPDIAINRVLFMSCLCIAASWIGYLLPVPQGWLQKRPLKLNQKSVRNLSIVYVCLGTLFNFLLFNLPDGETVGISGTSTGIVTIYIFLLRGFLYIGFPIVLIDAFKRFLIEKKIDLQNVFIICFSLSIPFFQAFFLGRRSSLSILILSIAIALFFALKILPFRFLVIALLVFAFISNMSIKEYRDGLQTQDWSDFKSINYAENISKYFNEEQGLELRNAALLMNFSADRGYYGWGSRYWDQLVFNFVPAQIVGTKLKNSLGLYKTARNAHLKLAYGYSMPKGTTITGIGESFTQFDYFGCIIFAITAIFCRYLWMRSLIWNDPLEQSIYINIIQAAAVGSVVTGHSFLISQIVGIIIFISPIIIFCRQKETSILKVSFPVSTISKF